MKKKLTHLIPSWNREKTRQWLMRLTVLKMVLLMSLLTSYGHVNSQMIISNLKLQEVELSEALQKIEEQTDYDFVFSYDDVEGYKVSVDLESASLEECLETVLHELPFVYDTDGDVVIVSYKKPEPVIEEEQDKKTITGQVTDKEGNPLPGVSVVFKGTNVGVATNIDGEYTLEFIDANYTLIFSFVGMISQEVDIMDQDVQNIILQYDTEQMGEIVVTGYQTISKERTTGSFGKIDNEVLEQRPVTSIAERLEGTVSGLNVVDGKIQIRGVSTLNANSEVLIVVDGFPIEGDLSSVNPEDINTVTVLKDASAASIWGVRASNGVVVITTKKGKKSDKLNIGFSAFVGVTDKIDYSDMDYMSTSENIDLALEFKNKGWNTYQMLLSRNYPVSLFDKAWMNLNGTSPDGDQWSQGQFNKYVNNLRTKDVEKQWEKYLLRNAIKSNYNLTFSGGSEKNTFYGSISYINDLGASIGNSSDNIAVNIQDSYIFNEKLSFTAGITASLNKAKENGVAPTAISSQQPYNDLVDANGQTIQYYTKHDRWSSQQREAMSGIGSYTFNQIDEQENTDISNERFSVRAKIGLDYKILANLKFSSSFQYEKESYDADQFNSMQLPSHRLRVYDFVVGGEEQIPFGTEYLFQRSEVKAWDFRNTLSWDKEWTDHKLNVFAGTEIRKYTYSTFNDKKYGYNKQSTTYVPVDQPKFMGREIKDWTGQYLSDTFYETSNIDEREFSMFSNIGYEFKEKYALNASFRIDQKNLFGSDPDFRYKPLWSAGIGWNISKEGFMQGADFVNRLKLRATYGINGNASNQFSPYAQARNTFRVLAGNNFDYLDLYQAANNSLKWEETAVLNIGMDFALFNNKLNGSLEYYSRKSNDLLGDVELDPSKGFASTVMNYASLLNRGVELNLNGTILSKGDFTWTSRLNFSYNHNEITDIEAERPAYWVAKVGNLEVGKSVNNIYSYNSAGLNENGDLLLNNADGTTSSITEVNPFLGFGVENLLYSGLKVAPFYGGLSNTFSYKNFDLSINLTYKFGHKFRNAITNMAYGEGGQMVQNHWNDRWQKPGDELKTRVPKLQYNGVNPITGEYEDLYTHYYMGEIYPNIQDHVYDASFIRVRDIVLGYTMPDNFLNLGFINSLRLTAQVTNPFLWVANDKGLDPEAYSGQAYNNLRTFTFGLKANF